MIVFAALAAAALPGRAVAAPMPPPPSVVGGAPSATLPPRPAPAAEPSAHVASPAPHASRAVLHTGAPPLASPTVPKLPKPERPSPPGPLRALPSRPPNLLPPTLLSAPVPSPLAVLTPPLWDPDARPTATVAATPRAAGSPSLAARPSRASDSLRAIRAYQSSTGARHLEAERVAASASRRAGAAAAALAERFAGSMAPRRATRAPSAAHARGGAGAELSRLLAVADRFMMSVPTPLFVLTLAVLVGMMLMFRRERRRARIAEHAALSDPLTGLPNRLALEHRLAIEWERARRYGRPLGIIALDLNELKLVNDHHGHAAGDRLLCQAADLLRRRVRRSDCAARLGGDEFVVVITETRSQEVAALADSVRHSLNAGGVSASVGHAQLAAGDSDPADVLRRADADMYQQKHAGRDQRHLRLAEPAPEAAQAATI